MEPERQQFGFYEDVIISQKSVRLPGILEIPASARGLILFAHGSGSSRFSPRNRLVAKTLQKAKLGTLLFDLLTESESEDRENVFDIPLLADRLLLATQWVHQSGYIQSGLPYGYFGASTGAAAALWAAAQQGKDVSAVVSRGGRPDMAIARLKDVDAPTLLIVGGQDQPVIEMNEEALSCLPHGKLVIIPGATHLFEEPGTLEEVSRLATEWFIENLTPSFSAKVGARSKR